MREVYVIYHPYRRIPGCFTTHCLVHEFMMMRELHVCLVTIALRVGSEQMSFQLYSGGVLTAACGTNLDHGVLLVGYGVSEDGVKYWKVKNSWGAEWGADGYILLKREAAQEGGECGVLMQASYPVLA